MVNKRHQAGGDSSTNFQADSITIYKGMSYDDARSIALDVFNQNAPRLIGVAKEIIDSRVSQFTDDLVSRIHARFGHAGLEIFARPEFLYPLLDSQKLYAKNGDRAAGDILQELLMGVAENRAEELFDVVIASAVEVTGKLTVAQIQVVTIIFLFTSVYMGCSSLEEFLEEIKGLPATIAEEIVSRDPSSDHLVFAGAAIYDIVVRDFKDIVGNFYPGYFTRGFMIDELEQELQGAVLRIRDSGLVIPCYRDPKRMQIAEIQGEKMVDIAEFSQLDQSARAEILKVNRRNILSEEVLAREIDMIDDRVAALRQWWDRHSLSRLRLTPVGKAIALANLKRLTGEALELSIWIK